MSVQERRRYRQMLAIGLAVGVVDGLLVAVVHVSLLGQAASLQGQLTYNPPDGSTVTRTVTASQEGGFTDTHSPDMEGEWSVRASWGGDENYMGSASASAGFTVRQPFPTGIVAAIVVAARVVVGLAAVRARRKQIPVPPQPAPEA